MNPMAVAVCLGAASFSQPGWPGDERVIANAAGDGPACPADTVTPFGLLNPEDTLGHLALAATEAPAADLEPPFDGPDIFDTLGYLRVFDEGCGG